MASDLMSISQTPPLFLSRLSAKALANVSPRLATRWSSSLSLCKVDLEAAVRRVEVLRKLAVKSLEFASKLEQFVVEPPFQLALMRLFRKPVNRIAALGARHVPGREHRTVHLSLFSTALRAGK